MVMNELEVVSATFTGSRVFSGTFIVITATVVSARVGAKLDSPDDAFEATVVATGFTEVLASSTRVTDCVSLLAGAAGDADSFARSLKRSFIIRERFPDVTAGFAVTASTFSGTNSVIVIAVLLINSLKVMFPAILFASVTGRTLVEADSNFCGLGVTARVVKIDFSELCTGSAAFVIAIVVDASV